MGVTGLQGTPLFRAESSLPSDFRPPAQEPRNSGEAPPSVVLRYRSRGRVYPPQGNALRAGSWSSTR